MENKLKDIEKIKADFEVMKKDYGILQERYRELKARSDQLKRELRQQHAGRLDSVNRLVEVERRNTSLAGLYTASYELHSTLEISVFTRTVIDLIVNLLGAESLAVYVSDDKGKTYAIQSRLGVITPDEIITTGIGFTGRVVELGEPYVIVNDFEYLEAIRDGDPVAVIPLKYLGTVIGIISIYTLLPHKGTFYDEDMDLLQLIGEHAGLALHNAMHYMSALIGNAIDYDMKRGKPPPNSK